MTVPEFRIQTEVPFKMNSTNYIAYQLQICYHDKYARSYRPDTGILILSGSSVFLGTDTWTAAHTVQQSWRQGPSTHHSQ